MKQTIGKSPPADGETEEVCGLVTQIVFRSEDTGYTVCNVKPAGGGSGAITLVGKCAAMWVGENVRARGKWVRHRRHGHQFDAEQITCMAPVTASGIKMYLSSGMIQGIGEVMAERLVEAFGDDTLKIIDKESARLLEVPGIGTKRRDMIRDSWKAQRAVRDIMIFLRSHSVGTAQANRIYKQYGDETIAVVTENPFRLCRDVWGIGFKSADTLALNLGIPSDSDIRARAGVQHVLQIMSDEGHCFSPWDILVEESQLLLGIDASILERAIEYGVEHRDLVTEEGNVYLAPLYHAEVSIARSMLSLLQSPGSFKPIDADKAVPWAAKQMRVEFGPAQEDALKTALTSKVSIITGGPGVGKTTIVKALVDVFAKRKLYVQLAAPTGRAAKRLSEATGAEARTIHRLLKFQPRTGQFEHGPDSPLPGDVFILDEVSMVDINLMQSFLGALAPASHLVLVGDSDQLPSVGPGNVLKDMISSRAVPFGKLDTIYRQQSRSWIVQNAHHVNRGEDLEVPTGEGLSDFYFIKANDPDSVISTMVEVVTKRIPGRFALDPRRDIQVLTPMRRNQLGATNLNTILQESINPSGPSITRFGTIYRVGDRVMQIRNNYDKEIFNGDIGVIRKVITEEQQVVVDFDGRAVDFEYAELDELDLAYACSIHKSQGSEYPAVVALMATQHYKLLQRNLLYTALTRGRKLVCLIGSSKAVYMAIKNNQTTLRRTSLARRLSK